jgi:hypothetical protein
MVPPPVVHPPGQHPRLERIAFRTPSASLATWRAVDNMVVARYRQRRLLVLAAASRSRTSRWAEHVTSMRLRERRAAAGLRATLPPDAAPHGHLPPRSHHVRRRRADFRLRLMLAGLARHGILTYYVTVGLPVPVMVPYLVAGGDGLSSHGAFTEATDLTRAAVRSRRGSSGGQTRRAGGPPARHSRALGLDAASDLRHLQRRPTGATARAGGRGAAPPACTPTNSFRVAETPP